MIADVGLTTGIFPLIIFMGVGALTDFGPLIANPKTALLGAAAQFGIFTTLIGSLLLLSLATVSCDKGVRSVMRHFHFITPATHQAITAQAGSP